MLVMVVEADHGIPGVSGNIDHLGRVQEARGQQGQGQVGLYKPRLVLVRCLELLQHILVTSPGPGLAHTQVVPPPHPAEQRLHQPPPESGHLVPEVQQCLKLQEWEPVIEPLLASLQVHPVRYLPYHLLSPGGPALRIGHNPDIIWSHTHSLIVLALFDYHKINLNLFTL